MQVKIIGVEPADANSMSLSLYHGERIMLEPIGGFADGVAVKVVGEETFRLCRELIDGVVLVSRDAICASIKVSLVPFVPMRLYIFMRLFVCLNLMQDICMSPCLTFFLFVRVIMSVYMCILVFIVIHIDILHLYVRIYKDSDYLRATLTSSIVIHF